MFESDPFKRAPLYYYLRRLGLAVEVKVSLAYDDAGTLLQHTSNTPAGEKQHWTAAGIGWLCFEGLNSDMLSWRLAFVLVHGIEQAKYCLNSYFCAVLQPVDVVLDSSILLG